MSMRYHRFTLAAVSLAGLLTFCGCAKSTTADKTSAAPFISNISSDEFDRLRQEKHYTILDVRTADEFAAGRIPGAILIDVNSPDFDRKIAELDRGQPYLVHCRSGRRSITACSRMSAAGFTQLYNLEGGILTWESAGKPVQK